MPDFIKDNTAIASAKSDLVPIGVADPTKHLGAADWNGHRQALLDIQAFLRGAAWLGLVGNSADPAPAGVPSYLWRDQNGHLWTKRGTVNALLDGFPSRSGRVGANSLPRLMSKLANYRHDLQLPVNIVGFGSSVQAGATLASPYVDGPTARLTSKLGEALDSAGLYNWNAYNCGIDGTTMAEFATAWAVLITQLQVTAIAISAAGAGYTVGDVLTLAGGTLSAGFTLPGLPTTIEVVAVNGAGAVTRARVRRAGMYQAGLAPASPNTPTGGTGAGAQFTRTTAAIVPTVVQFGYGMNDGGPAIFNSGQTFPGFIAALQRAVNTIHQVGADLLMLTSPHPAVVNHAATVFAFPGGIPQNYPTVIAAPVPMTSVEPPYPNRPDSGSSLLLDLKNGGPSITVAHRFMRVNQAMRQVAADYGAAIGDAEWYWFEALQAKTTELGSQAAAENALYNTGESVHPNLLGHQLSYHRAVDDFCFSLAQQAHQASYEPRLNGYQAINGPGTTPASAVLDVYPPYPDMTTKPLSLKARTGAADGNGIKANVEHWYVDPAVGDWVSGCVRFPTTIESKILYYGNSYSGYSQRLTSYNIGAGATLDIPIIDDPFFNGRAGKVRIHCNHSGVALSQVSEVLFSSHSGTLTIAAGTQIGAATEFTFAVSGTNIRITNVFANANYFIHIETW